MIPRLTCALLFTVAACQSVNPDSGHFHCESDADCGTGYQCRAQFGGGGICFKVGECIETEKCDGVDENCDGRIDETFPEAGQACSTSQPGVCSAGTQACLVGALICQPSLSPSEDVCNGSDDDCDGSVDEGFDFSSDDSNCGNCNHVCEGATVCRLSQCQESSCDDGVDNDGDELIDCLDESCLGQVCATPLPPSWRCGAVVVDGGTTLGCYAPETDCANGSDDDGDGNADCLDSDCDGLICASGTQCSNHLCPGPG